MTDRCCAGHSRRELLASGGPIRLIPYHRIAHERYATYWTTDAALGRATVPA